MKQRNYLLALALLALFAAAGVFYFRSYVVQKPFGIILFVGEGLVTSKLTAARLYDGGADRRLALESLPNVALLSTHAADFAVPDAASAAGALACGEKLNHRALGLDPSGKRLTTLLEQARAKGRALGLVTDGSLTDPTPAAFYAHAADSREREGLAAQLATLAPEVILGGGGGDFLPELKGGRRRGPRDITLEMTQRDYTLLRSSADLQAVQTWLGPKLLGLFNADALIFRDQLDAQSVQPSLAEMVRRAIEVLQRKTGGYLLVVDAGLVERASQKNESERALQQLIELDRAVAVALQYAGAKTLVIAAGGQSTGGMALNGYPLRRDWGVSLLGVNAAGFPSISWSTGPNGPTPAASPAQNPDANATALAAPTPGGEVGSKAKNGNSKSNNSPAASYASYAANVADDAVAAGFGPGSERLRGFVDNTFIFELINGQL
jgi:alkaline phosphatase